MHEIHFKRQTFKYYVCRAKSTFDSYLALSYYEDGLQPLKFSIASAKTAAVLSKSIQVVTLIGPFYAHMHAPLSDVASFAGHNARPLNATITSTYVSSRSTAPNDTQTTSAIKQAFVSNFEKNLKLLYNRRHVRYSR